MLLLKAWFGQGCPLVSLAAGHCTIGALVSESLLPEQAEPSPWGHACAQTRRTRLCDANAVRRRTTCFLA